MSSFFILKMQVINSWMNMFQVMSRKNQVKNVSLQITLKCYYITSWLTLSGSEFRSIDAATEKDQLS